MTPNGPSVKAYAERRRKLLAKLDNAALFLPGSPEAVFSNDVHYKYRPDTNIRYLTGFEEPSSLLLSQSTDPAGLTLFVTPRNPKAEIWTGRRAGVDGAVERYGADQAFPLEEQLTVLEKCATKVDAIYYSPSQNAAANHRFYECVERLNRARPRLGLAPLVVQDAAALLSEMRLYKSAEEIACLARACDISAEAHRLAMASTQPGAYEYQVEATIEHEFRSKGCAGPAYGTIVAGGANATVLHYTSNGDALSDGDLLLIDAGGEYGGYCADITRTFPVGKTFSTAQAELYDLVLASQHAAIDAAVAGKTIEDVHGAACRVLVSGLVDCGLLDGNIDELLESNAIEPFYMHRTSHWLGMDVHDVGLYKRDEKFRPLEAGMVLTVEPGLYFAEDADVEDKYRGIGIRIEDDILVTDDGNKNLTADAPKNRNEIEALRAAAYKKRGLA